MRGPARRGTAEPRQGDGGGDDAGEWGAAGPAAPAWRRDTSPLPAGLPGRTERGEARGRGAAGAAADPRRARGPTGAVRRRDGSRPRLLGVA